MNFKNVSNDNLLLNIKKLSGEERRIATEILHHLKEIEFRRLHLKIGYSSLFEYAVKELGYSEDAAYRRISAMRLLKSVPEIETKINNGTLTLAGAAKIQKFISSQNKEAALQKSQPNLQNDHIQTFDTKLQKMELIESLENKSLKEIDRAIVSINPISVVQEKVRQIDEEKVELKLIIDDELRNELDQLKNLLSHRNPNMSYRDLIKFLAQLGLKKFDPSIKAIKSQSEDKNKSEEKNLNQTKKNQRNVSGQTRRPASQNSRNIPSAVKQEVYMRDKGCCSYMDPQTRRRCTSRYLLQYDHKYPYSLGGKTSVENLRLLCFQHHQFVTENVRSAGL